MATSQNAGIPRSEYPRPQFVRDNWLCLNGTWDFSFDSDTFDQKITVPYAYQTKLSGIDVQAFHDTVWYRRFFELPADMQAKRVLLHFGAVDYECEVWVNGQHVKSHTGGHVGFYADITAVLVLGQNEIRLMAIDDSKDLEMPRGKQYWEEKSAGIFYTRTTGIWQSVWLEAVGDSYLECCYITPDIDTMSACFEYEIAGDKALDFQVKLSYQGAEVATQVTKTGAGTGKVMIKINPRHLATRGFAGDLLWSPERPNLFDVEYQLMKDGAVIDSVRAYFGMRKVSIEQGRFMLNNFPYYQKLLLDQGYWEDSLLTAPADEDFVKDIDLCKKMGFNGVRKHQKVEDPRFLYHADTMGLLVWGEIANAYAYSQRYVKRISQEWTEAVKRDYNHPSIVAWTPINESWGVPEIHLDKQQQAHCAAMVYLTKSLDPSRPVVSNDGWEHTTTDLFTLHDYQSSKDALKKTYATIESALAAAPSLRMPFAAGWRYEGQPLIVSEFGGISYQKGEWSGWGYSNAVSDEDFAKRYYEVVSALLESPLVQGFCYTQITDVEQEINGLLTYRREPKIDVDIIRAINEGRWKPEA